MYLASGLDSLAERARGGLGVEGVRHEQVLRRVHDEGAAPHVAPDAQERQVAHSALHYGSSLLETNQYLFRLWKKNNMIAFWLCLYFGRSCKMSYV